MSEVDDSLVKIGYWIDWSRGSVMGRTITTPSVVSNILISLLTVIITIAMSQLWSLSVFFYHQLRAKSEDGPRDGMFWQQQALLRTFPTPSSLFFESLKMWWAWRRVSNRTTMRSLVPAAMALLFASVAVASSMFSAHVVSSSNLSVLVNSPDCRRLKLDRMMSHTGDNGILSSYVPVVKTYAKDCYKSPGGLPSRCQNTFVEAKISLSISPADCPWEDTMCLPLNNHSKSAVAIDSGIVHGSRLGFNHEPHNGISIRKKTICNVLPFENRLRISNSADPPRTGVPRPLLSRERFWMLETHLRRMKRSNRLTPGLMFMSELVVNTSETYKTNAVMLREHHRSSYLSKDSNVPIKEMNRTNADTSISVIWLNSVTNVQPNNDPVFSAHVPFEVQSVRVNGSLYRSDRVVGVIGCANQYQFCHSRKGRDDYCSPLRGLVDPENIDVWPDANEIQHLSLLLITDAFGQIDSTWGPIAGLTLAGEELNSGVAAPLPDNQWEKEVFAWETYVWAGLQILLTDYAIGQKWRDPKKGNYTDVPLTATEKQMCGAMVMKKSGGFANIHVFGLAFILTFTVVVSILNIYMLRFFIFLSKSRRALAPCIDHWVHDGVFQLQRRAFEARGQGTWKNIHGEIPVTETDEPLSSGVGETNIGLVYIAQQRAYSTRETVDSVDVSNGHRSATWPRTESHSTVAFVPPSVVSENTSTETSKSLPAVYSSASVEPMPGSSV